MKVLSVLVIMIGAVLGSAAYAHDSRLEARVDRLESLSHSLARDARRAGIYGSLYLDAEHLAREASRLKQALRNNRNTAYVDSRFRDIERRYDRFDRRYRSLNTRHHRGSLYQNYIEIGAIFGDIRLFYAQPTARYRGINRGSDRSLRGGFSNSYSHKARKQPSYGYRSDKSHGRRNSHDSRGAQRFDREDSRRNHYRK